MIQERMAHVPRYSPSAQSYFESMSEVYQGRFPGHLFAEVIAHTFSEVERKCPYAQTPENS